MVEVLVYLRSVGVGRHGLKVFVCVCCDLLLLFDVVFDVLLMMCDPLRGEFVQAVGSVRAGLGQFSFVSGLVLSPDETKLVVADSNHTLVIVVDVRDGQIPCKLRGPAGTLKRPCGVANVARTGKVLVVDVSYGLVVVFAGVYHVTVVGTLGDGWTVHGPRQLHFPEGDVMLDEDDAADRPVAVVTDTGNHRLSCCRVDDDTLLRHVGSGYGAAPGQNDSPYIVSLVSSEVSGMVRFCWWWSDNLRVQVLTLLGAVASVLGLGGSRERQILE